MPDRLFEDLYRDTERLHWASTGEVRERGRQLARQRTYTVLAAVLVLLAGGGIGAWNALADSGRRQVLPDVVATAPATRTPSPTPSRTPTPTAPSSPSGSTGDPGRPTGTAIPAAATLQRSDVPSGFRSIGQNPDGNWVLHSVSGHCPNTWQHPGRKVAEREQGFAVGERRLVQRVHRYAGTDARQAMAAVRTNVDGCAGADRIEITVVDRGFAGEESVLVAAEVEGVRNLWVFVRRADLVTEIWIKNGTDHAEARRLADRAAVRLCAGTTNC
ncbi:hypothetical protein [Plantactinospora sp. WMMB782]|uniref:hypothetical protein n=1 Tax=Plantactinospora sp. WMMB782 TaxID=3404121 RepID=UPI003B932A58